VEPNGSPSTGERVDESHQRNVYLLNDSDGEPDRAGVGYEIDDEFHGSLHTLVLAPVDLLLVKASCPIQADAVVVHDPVPITIVIVPRIPDDLW